MRAVFAGQRCGAMPFAASMTGKAAHRGGARNWTYRTGHYTADAKFKRREVRALIRELRSL